MLWLFLYISQDSPIIQTSVAESMTSSFLLSLNLLFFIPSFWVGSSYIQWFRLWLLHCSGGGGSKRTQGASTSLYQLFHYLHSAFASFTWCSSQFMWPTKAAPFFSPCLLWLKSYLLTSDLNYVYQQDQQHLFRWHFPSEGGHQTLAGYVILFIWIPNGICFWPFRIIKNLIPNDCERRCEVNLAVLTPGEQAENTNQQISFQTMREPAGSKE